MTAIVQKAHVEGRVVLRGKMIENFRTFGPILLSTLTLNHSIPRDPIRLQGRNKLCPNPHPTTSVPLRWSHRGIVCVHSTRRVVDTVSINHRYYGIGVTIWPSGMTSAFLMYVVRLLRPSCTDLSNTSHQFSELAMDVLKTAWMSSFFE